MLLDELILLFNSGFFLKSPTKATLCPCSVVTAQYLSFILALPVIMFSSSEHPHFNMFKLVYSSLPLQTLISLYSLSLTHEYFIRGLSPSSFLNSVSLLFGAPSSLPVFVSVCPPLRPSHLLSTLSFCASCTIPVFSTLFSSYLI